MGVACPLFVLLGVAAMYVDPALLVMLLGVALTGLIALVTWVVKQINTHAEFMAVLRVEQVALADRVKSLEVWRDGVSFGRAVERSGHDRRDGE